MKNHPILFLKTYGLRLFVNEGLILLLNKLNIFHNYKNKLICKKHNLIINYLEKNYSYIINKYKKLNYKERKVSNKIWVYWYQGVDSAPELVKMCINSMKKNLYDSEIIILTKDNLEKYIQLPKYLKEKHENGTINKTNFSDIVRMFVLERYGGFWFDATILVTEKKSNKELNEIKTIKFHNNDLTSISNGLWCGFCLGNINHKFFAFVKEIFIEFWKDKNIIIDYFLIDYIIKVAYNNFEEVKKDIDNNRYNNESIHGLCGMLNDEFNERKYKEILNNNYIHKLSFKMSLKDDVNGKKTYYKYIKEVYYEK